MSTDRYEDRISDLVRHLNLKYVWIFVFGHNVFLETQSFPPASENC